MPTRKEGDLTEETSQRVSPGNPLGTNRGTTESVPWGWEVSEATRLSFGGTTESVPWGWEVSEATRLSFELASPLV